MKTKILLVLISILNTVAFAQVQDSRTQILENSVVKSTYALMQSKHNGACNELNINNVNLMCTGLMKPRKKLELLRSTCGVAITIKCPTESAYLFGEQGSISAFDSSGHRNDVKPVAIELSFRSINIKANQ